MYKRQVEDCSYGLGISVVTQWGYEILGHSGSAHGAVSYSYYIPELDVSLVALVNTNGTTVRNHLSGLNLLFLFELASYALEE